MDLVASAVRVSTGLGGAKTSAFEIHLNPDVPEYSLIEVGSVRIPRTFPTITKVLNYAHNSLNIPVSSWQYDIPFSTLDDADANLEEIERQIVHGDKWKYIGQGAVVPFVCAGVLFCIGYLLSMNGEEIRPTAEHVMAGRNWIFWGTIVAVLFAGFDIIAIIFAEVSKVRHWYRLVGGAIAVCLIAMAVLAYKPAKPKEKPKSGISLLLELGKKD